MDSSSVDSIVWGKWIALGCLIAALITIVVSIRFYSIRRMREGHNALPGTAWMVPPRYTAAITDREGIPQVAAPPYNREVGEQDAGFYDKDGNFVARPRETAQPPPATPDGITLQELPSVEPRESQPPGYAAVERIV